MNKEKLKSEYQEILAEGVKQEKSRIFASMIAVDGGNKILMVMAEAGESLTQTQTAETLMKKYQAVAEFEASLDKALGIG